MERIFNWIANGYVAIASVSLMLASLSLLVSAILRMARAIPGGDFVEATLDSVGLLVIGFAVVETAKFIAEEELLRKRELRAAAESRRSLTKFVTIIVIAASLEALVMVFKTSRAGYDPVFPALLFLAAMLALVALGLYQWLSSRIQSDPAQERHDKAEAGRDSN